MSLPYESIQDSSDTILDGQITIQQSTSGYRFNIDSVILAGSVTGKHKHVLDLGCGSGIISMLLLHRMQCQHVIGIDVQNQMVYRAVTNAHLNGYEKQFSGMIADVRNLGAKNQKFHCIVANPPFFDAQAGRVSPNQEKRIARQGTGETLKDWGAALCTPLRDNGVGYVIFPTMRYLELGQYLNMYGKQITWLRFIHPYINKDSNRVVIRYQKTITKHFQCIVAPPLVVHNRDGSYCDEVKAMLA